MVENNMSINKQQKIDFEIKKIHTEVKRASHILRKRIQDIQTELSEWDNVGGYDEDGNNLLQ